MNKIDRKTGIIGLGFLLVGLLLGWIFFGGSPESTESQRQAETNHEHGQGDAEVWTCAMHPQIREAGPGKCPICGMDLVPVSAEGGEMIAENEIQMTEAAMALANIQTVTVEHAVPTKRIYLPGKVQADERRIAAVTSRFPGRIEKLYVNFTGQEVKKGQRLASIYSPELIQAQKELLTSLRYKETNPSFYAAALNKLKLWDLTDAQIQRIIENNEMQYNFDIYSTQSGTIISKNINEGDYVNEGQAMFDIANLSKVWVLFDAYESDLPWIEKGDEIKFTVQSVPGKVFTSKVTFIDAVINPQTRVASVRTEVDNPGGKLKPEMFAQGIFESRLDTVERSLVIPKSAVLWTGKKAVVYVKDPSFEQPTFEFRELVLGPEAGDFYVVAEGLKEGEEVVGHGVFKVDAAAQLQGKISMMNPEEVNRGSEIKGEQIPTSEFIEGEAVDFRKQTPAVFRAQLDEVVDAYLALKEALVQRNFDATQQYSATLLTALNELDGNLLKGKAKAFWQEKRQFIIEHANLLKQAPDMKVRKEQFIFLSQSLIKILEVYGSGTKTLYIDFCPMANENKGAYWISEVKEIRNPFMSENMLTCGEVKDTIKN